MKKATAKQYLLYCSQQLILHLLYDTSDKSALYNHLTASRNVPEHLENPLREKSNFHSFNWNIIL